MKGLDTVSIDWYVEYGAYDLDVLLVGVGRWCLCTACGYVVLYGKYAWWHVVSRVRVRVRVVFIDRASRWQALDFEGEDHFGNLGVLVSLKSWFIPGIKTKAFSSYECVPDQKAPMCVQGLSSEDLKGEIHLRIWKPRCGEHLFELGVPHLH